MIPRDLTKYLQYEFFAYEALSELGEHISIIDEEQIGVPSTGDFLVFDRYSLAKFNFDSQGILLGGYIETEPSIISQHIKFFDDVSAKSVDLGSWVSQHKKKFLP